MPDSTIALALLAAAFLLALLSGWRIAVARGPVSAVAVVVLRILVLGLVACLLGLVGSPREERIEGRPLAEEEERIVIFLQDRSLSMDFMTAEGRSRGELAEETWRDFAALASSSPGEAACEVERMLFAANLVDEDASAEIEPEATYLAPALSTCLGREKVRAVVVVSDGASTDGPVPGHVLDWARNRGVPVHAICAADPAGAISDVAVRRADCPLTNPLWIDVRVACEGPTAGDASLELSVDGEVRSTRTLRLQEMVDCQLEVPDLDKGWHSYACTVKVDRPEITTLNNVAHGVFRIAPAEEILYIMGPPRPDNPQTIRVLRGLWPERFNVTNVRDPNGFVRDSTGAVVARLGDINVRNVRLAILADVAPRDVPPRLLAAMDAGEVVTVVLAGDELGPWAERRSGHFPIARVGPVREIEGVESGSGEVLASSAAAKCGLGKLRLDGVRLGHVQEAEPRASCEVLLRVRDGTRDRPLLVLDRAPSPRGIALLTDVAWKWALSPEPAVRAAYGDMWTGLTKWVLIEDEKEAPLDLAFGQDPKDVDATLVRVSPTGGRTLESLRDVRLVVELEGEADGKKESVRPRRGDGAYVFSYECPERPRVAWFQATALCEGAEVRSERRPLALPVFQMEFLDTRPHHGRIESVASGKDRFAFWRDRGPVLERALEVRVEKPFEYFRVPEERNARRELTLAVVCFLLVACEWFIERRAYAGKEAS
ncbi:MAG: vWA domain-containing protein [Planctomycetota bacterium]|jgi:hypothetical protein